MIGRSATGEVIRGAVAEARLRGDRRIGTESLLLGVLRQPDFPADQLLGVDLAAARQALAALDEEALALLGIDVSPPADPPTASGWPPLAAMPPGLCTPASPRQSPPTPAQVARLRAAMSSGARAVMARAARTGPVARPPTPEGILIALLEREPPDPAAALLIRLGVDRARALARLGEPARSPADRR
jgi:hypothetical protein